MEVHVRFKKGDVLQHKDYGLVTVKSDFSPDTSEMIEIETIDSGCCAVLPQNVTLYAPVEARLMATPTPSPLPADSVGRKAVPLATGCLYYFPAALAEVARLSKVGNDKHNPGQPLHHARSKSTDHADCIVRHQIDVGTIDPETGFDHAVMVAWRALAQLQELLESRGAPLARGARP